MMWWWMPEIKLDEGGNEGEIKFSAGDGKLVEIFESAFERNLHRNPVEKR